MKTDIPIFIGPEQLEKIWTQWLSEKGYLFARSNFAEPKFLRNTHKLNKRREKFELWLFEQGGTIRQINKELFLIFADHPRASLFILKNC